VIQSKTMVLCADDFGFTHGISQGILKLVRMNRLSAVSCMVNMPGFIAYAPELQALKDQVQVGLHFNLTEGYFLSSPNTPCFSLSELLIKTHLMSIKLTFIAQELKQQLARFVEVMGCLPDFIDGHQHVHQFPRIRQVLLDVYDQQLRQQSTSIRATYPILSSGQYRLKAKIMALTGGKALSAELKRRAIPHNLCFSGVYDFSPKTNYRALFCSWLSSLPDSSLIMCHPGEQSEEQDVIASTRLLELNYFLSDQFVTDCAQYEVQLAGR
jgi:predicted glycoside hydrolase/deacetylase ChbG (UPF0249 family)